MNMKFILNEQVLIWNLLFRESFSKKLNSAKQKIWYNYEKQYNKLFKEKDNLLGDIRNYIPNDDRIYNVFKETDVYNDIYTNTDRYKLNMRKVWNLYKKDVFKEVNDILRIKLIDYTIYVVDPRLNICSYVGNNPNLIYGKVLGSDQDTIIDLIYNVIEKEFNSYSDDKNLVLACIELAIKNELATRIHSISYYSEGSRKLGYLKRRIYPYFLMYLGIEQKEFTNYMKRDGIVFDQNFYEYNDKLKKMNLYKFIDFLEENKASIIKLKSVD